MDIEQFRTYCLSKKGSSESLPFGPDTLVFKVFDKIFAICSLSDFQFVNLKCNPEKAVELREQYPDLVCPAYHMNKKHWNGVSILLPNTLVTQLIDHSFDLVFLSLPKSKRQLVSDQS